MHDPFAALQDEMLRGLVRTPVIVDDDHRAVHAFFDRVEKSMDSTVVIIDNHRCAYQATQHLILQGCKRIMHITASLTRNVYAERYRGYRDALSDHSLPFDEALLVVSDL